MFDIDSVVSILKKRNYRYVVLQFLDEFLPVAVEVHNFFQSALPQTQFCIVADSSWGASADDISAQHVEADVLVFFGSDLSSSSSLPVIIVPEVRQIDMLAAQKHIFSTFEKNANVLVLYEPSFYYAAIKLSMGLSCRVHVGRLPVQADIENWSEVQDISGVNIGGIYFDSEVLQENNLIAVYLGDKSSQLQSIVFRLSNISTLQFCPLTSTVSSHLGCQSAQLRERYGGINKVETAKVIGIILGSMGIDNHRTQKLIQRLEKLVLAAGKKYYTFVMGRINEAKLCNFPEIDLYCLIANDDVGMIKPRTFHTPLVTPCELELGLKAKAWESTLAIGIDELLGSNIDQALENIEQEWGQVDTHLVDCPFSPNLESTHQEALVVFDSAAADYFQGRSFKGLNEDRSTSDLIILNGQVGTAAKYDHIVK